MPRRFLILAEGHFGPQSSKTASACIRYARADVVAVLDSTKVGHTAQQILGFGGDIPVVGSFDDGLSFSPNALLIGIAPAGGQFPDSWRALVLRALRARMDVWSGLHTLLGDDREFAEAARASGATIHDLRRAPVDLTIGEGLVRALAATVILTVGTDCNIGKMTTQLQLRDALRASGVRASFAATGQTGILIEGRGIGVDAVVADFFAGAAERLTLEAADNADIVLVEGQGSIIHPSYSGVTLGLMHGAMPHAMVLCAQPSRTAINRCEWVPIPPLTQMIALYEHAMSLVRPAPVIAIALNTFDLSDAAAREAVDRAQQDTGLPVTDTVRYDAAPITEAMLRFHRERTRV